MISDKSQDRLIMPKGYKKGQSGDAEQRRMEEYIKHEKRVEKEKKNMGKSASQNRAVQQV